MLSLQKTFNYNGDAGKIGLNEINIEFLIPGFAYDLDPEFGTPYRIPTNENGKYILLNKLLADDEYRADLPLDLFFKKGKSSLKAFIKYYQLRLPFKSFSDIEYQSIQIAVNFYATSDNSLIGSTTLDAFLLFNDIKLNFTEFTDENIKNTTANEEDELLDLLTKNIYLVNKSRLTEMSAFLETKRSGEINSYLPFVILSLIPLRNFQFKKPDSDMLKAISMRLKSVYKDQTKDLTQVVNLVFKSLDNLFDFPLDVQAIETIDVEGTFSLITSEGKVATENDLFLFDLEMSYIVKNDKITFPVNKHIDWETTKEILKDNSIKISFTKKEAVIPKHIAGNIQITIKDVFGVELKRFEYKPKDPALQKLELFAELQEATTSPAETTTSVTKTKKLRGQVFDITNKCHIKDAVVVIQAKKEADTNWRIVGTSHTDNSGNFSLPYPYGNYTEAQAIVSLTPDAPVAIVINTDSPDQSISDDFLYLMIRNIICVEAEEDCECHSGKKTTRLPDQTDLINSNEYTQDIGGSCVNLSTPNRTLSEFNYKAVVRISDPDVANYTLNKIDNDFELNFGGKKISREPIDLDNPIRWQDTPEKKENTSLYQAVTVATGHILHYKSLFKADGYSLGELLYSLGLAPGQKKQIVVFDAGHSLQAGESQTISQGERVAAGLISEREIISQLGGNISEAMRGSSTASTGGISGGLGVGAIMGPVGAVLGVAGGYASSSSSASQNNSRNMSQFFSEKLKQSITQNADSYRELNASVVSTVREGQTYAATTEVVSNHNHCHALTMMYFEVLRHYAIYQELSSVEECVFVPLLMTNFTQENIYKWRDVLAPNLLPMPSQTYLPKTIFSGGYHHPLLKGFDAVERIKTNYENVDFPAGSYDQELINFFKGELQLRVNLPRPKTRYDRIKSLPIISQTNSHTEGFLGGGVGGGIAGGSIGAVAGAAIGSLVFPVVGTIVGGIIGGAIGASSGSQQTTVVDSIELVKKQVFDAFMEMDANYQSVPPAQCIRIKSFQPVTLSIGSFGNFTVSGPDFFDGDVNDKKQWEGYASLLGYEGKVLDMLDYYFKGRLIAEWDEIFYNDMLPVIFKKIVDSIRIGNLSLDLSSTVTYRGKEQLVRVNINGASPNKTRRGFEDVIILKIVSDQVKALLPYVLLNVERLKLVYHTAHYSGTLFNGFVGDDLLDDTELYIPITEDEKRNPRVEDVFLRNKLIEHLNSNLEYYNKALWYKLDPDRRFMLLDGFNIPVYNSFGVPTGKRSLASIVKNELITITGNSLVFPVANGYRVGRSFIREVNEENDIVELDLFEHYKPVTPIEPYRVSIPSKGVFVEAVQGACDACEKVKENSSQDWTKFTTDEPTPISTIVAPTPEITDWKAAFKEFAQPIVNIQNAPANPAPGQGLTGLSEALTKSGIFKDITGLDGNQKNVMETYKSNQENAKAFAEMAKTMAMQGHNTTNSQKIMDSLNSAKASGAINSEEYGKLVKDHLQQQIDGGESKKAQIEKEKAAEPSLSKAAVKAVDDGKTVKAQKTDKEGNTEIIEIEGTEEGKAIENVLAEVKGEIPALKQENSLACWATAATMMVSWKNKVRLMVRDVLANAGEEYLIKFEKGEGLASSEKELFITRLDMMAEAPGSYPLQAYIDLLNSYGPLWITTDSSNAAGKFSPHARILIKIKGTGTADGIGTNFEFINPSSGKIEKQTFLDFIKAFEQMVTDNLSDNLFLQIVHFTDAIPGATLGEGAETTANSFSIDRNFIHEIENPGGLNTPTVPTNNSGVTVADGLDLGQHNSGDIKKLNLSSDLETKLKPYLLLKGDTARKKIEELPLELTEEEIDEINLNVIGFYSGKLEKEYNKRSAIKFADIPAIAQTVIYSLFHQKGNLAASSPRFTAEVTKQKWMNAVNELYNFGDDFETRRRKEADYLLTFLLPGIDGINAEMYNHFYAAKILDRVADDTLHIKLDKTRTNLQNIKDGNNAVAGTFKMDPKTKLFKILPVISHIIDCIDAKNKTEIDSINLLSDAAAKTAALIALKEKAFNRIVLGSFIREDSPTSGHHGQCMDFNILDTASTDTPPDNLTFEDPLAMEMVLFILQCVKTLPALYNHHFGFGFPYQADFVSPGKGVSKTHVAAEHIINTELRTLVTSITNNHFPDDPNHLHMQAG